MNNRNYIGTNYIQIFLNYAKNTLNVSFEQWLPLLEQLA